MMKRRICVFALFYISQVAAEIVYLQDTNADHEKRNLDFGLPENLQFRFTHSSGNEVHLNLRENKGLNANAPVYEPATDSQGHARAVRNTNIRPNNRVRYYQDSANDAFMTVECMKSDNGPCTRLLTGNLVVNGQEHKLEPAMEAMNKRELPYHLGTPHTMETLTDTFMYDLGAVSGHHGEIDKVVAAHTGELDGTDDSVTHESDYPTTTEDYNAGETVEQLAEERRQANELLLQKLLGRLIRQKRAPVAHGVEILMVIDHTIYNDFAARYTGDSEIKYRIREYYSHIINGVDLRYRSIEESDFSIYVTISGFFISNDVSESPWLDYSKNPTNSLAGLEQMRTWRKSTAGLPQHDHATLITGTDIHYGNNRKVAGLAYMSGVCNSYRVSISEEFGFFQGSSILAHELGHNLGANHDSGGSGSGCHKNDKYVMAPYVPSLSATSAMIRPWRFSSCSINAFRKYFKSLGRADCTLNNALVYNNDEFNKNIANLAGQLYSEEEQCVLLRGKGAQVCGNNKMTSDICRNLLCSSAGKTSCTRYVAAPGTPCGNNLMCYEGLCQKSAPVTATTPTKTSTAAPVTATTPTKTSTAAVVSTSKPPTTKSPSNAYECKDVGSGGMTCPELKTFMGNSAKMCRLFFGQCCQYCYTNGACSNDKKIYGAKKYSCPTLSTSLGLEDTCKLFPYECCSTCRSLAQPNK